MAAPANSPAQTVARISRAMKGLRARRRCCPTDHAERVAELCKKGNAATRRARLDALRGRLGASRRLEASSPDDFRIPSVTIAELFYGAERSANPTRAHAVWRAFVAPFQVVPFDREAA